MKRYIRSSYELTKPTAYDLEDPTLRQKYLDEGIIDDRGNLLVDEDDGHNFEDKEGMDLSVDYNSSDIDYDPEVEGRLERELSKIQDENDLIKLLDKYAASPDVNKRVAAARNEMTRVSTLLKLANDTSDVVLGYLVWNPNTPSSVPRKLIADLKGTPRNYRRMLKSDLRQWSADNK